MVIASKTASTETLLTNLRLLDLDEEFDWPAIQIDTFGYNSGVQDQQERCYAAQWLLYKLFSLHDPDWTNDALCDLFPPLEPKQASELRLRLYKQLALLKQNGVFAPDIALRRSMLDDCKGPKFESVLIAFSSVVLQSVLAQCKDDHSFLKRMTAGTARLDKRYKMPLVLAYESVITRLLEQRQMKELRWKRLNVALEGKGNELQRASAVLDEAIGRRPREKRIPKRMLDRLRMTLESQWVGHKAWAEILLHSDKHMPRATFLERSFDNIWSHACDDTLHQIQPRINDSLLQELQHRLDKQNERLATWRTIQRDALAQMEEIVALEADHSIEGPSSQNAPVFTNINLMRYPDHTHSRYSEPEPESPQSMYPDMSLQFSTPGTHPRSLPLRAFPPLQTSDGYGESPSATQDSPLCRNTHDAFADRIISSVSNAAPTPMRPALTLAERTRLSMARLSPLRQHHGSPHSADTDLPELPEAAEQAAHEPSTPEAPRYLLLAERTRQSMSNAKFASRPPVKKPRVSRVSNIYPINQFATPRKAIQGIAESPDTSILEERLDAFGVDEESAFMSRPLLAKSPPPPRRTSDFFGDDDDHAERLSDR